MPRARQEFPIIYQDEYIFAAGGMNDTSYCCNALSDFDKYRIKEDRWIKCADLPLAISHPGVCSLGGYIYVISGYTGGSYHEQPVTTKCFRYSDKVDKWQQIADIPLAASAPGIVTRDGKIYVFGGDSDMKFDNNGNSTVYEYNPDSDRWKLINDQMPFGRMHIGAAIINNKVYISPGRPGRITNPQDDIVQEFDFENAAEGKKAWRLMNRLPEYPRTGYISNWPEVNGKLYYICGEKPTALNIIHEFSPDDNGGIWTRIGDFTTPLHGIGPVAVGNKIYICGGAAGGRINKKTDQVWVIEIFVH